MATGYSDLVAGTAITWTSSGGDKVLTGTSLTDGSAREGDKSATWVDGTKGLPEIIEVRFETKVGSAATNGTQVELYVGESDSATAGTNNPGNLTGADAALSNPSELTPQLIFVGALVLSNARGTNTQKQRFRWKPLQAYTTPVVYNRSGQTLSGTGTDTVVVMTPFYRRTPVS